MEQKQPTIYTCDNCLKVDKGFERPKGWRDFKLMYLVGLNSYQWGKELLVCFDCLDANMRPEVTRLDRSDGVTRNIFQKIFRL